MSNPLFFFLDVLNKEGCIFPVYTDDKFWCAGFYERRSKEVTSVFWCSAYKICRKLDVEEPVKNKFLIKVTLVFKVIPLHITEDNVDKLSNSNLG